ncbi:hypothetical protein PUN49_13990 [Pseudomonas extremaustralis]|uniref:hypothetical protein n=1 Tax=Pseudomonas extremaustralis TaxID=359110 RepID=UPI0021C8866F|nr:hypothetical protein [Pseudomonas extremaustralis]MDG2968144.1 hypothetical protein [Pseudomonas extremaustralis]UUJ40279.1 hypothetical protein L1A22_26985 [Pseudomonas extremaustralis]
MLMSGEVVTFNAVVNNLQDVPGYSWSFSPGFVFQNVNAPNIAAKAPVVTQSTAGRVVVLVYRSGPNPTSLSKDVVIEPKPVDSPAPVAAMAISGPATVEAGKTLTLSGVGSSGDNRVMHGRQMSFRLRLPPGAVRSLPRLPWLAHALSP